MKSNAAKFAWDINGWLEKQVVQGSEAWARQIMFDLVSEVVQRTPVKSGRARGSWLLSVGMSAPRLWTPLDKSGDQTVFRALRNITEWQPGMPVQLYSHAPYMARLETGYSKQAPSGMLAGAVLAVLSKSRRAA